MLAALELPVVVVTNQRGIERGHMTAADLEAIHGKMRSAVAAAGGRIDAVYHCPHEGGCACRKPGVLLFERAGRDLDFEPANAAVLGDRASDMEAARRLGALAIAVAGTDTDDADYSAVDLVDAVGWLKEPL